MKKIKIAYLIDTLKRAGAQKIVLDICQNIDKKKFDVALIFWRKDAWFDMFKGIKGLRMIQLKNSPPSIRSNVFTKLLVFIKRFGNRRFRCDNNVIESFDT